METIKTISSFTGDYAFLSNFYECQIFYNGRPYKSSEAAYQSMKTMSTLERDEFSKLSPDEAKRKGRQLSLRHDWEDIKDDIMYKVLVCKFSQNPDLSKQLVLTGDAELVEGNTWGDTYWGVCNGVGEDRLGMILMRIRDEFKDMYYTEKNGCKVHVKSYLENKD